MYTLSVATYILFNLLFLIQCKIFHLHLTLQQPIINIWIINCLLAFFKNITALFKWRHLNKWHQLKYLLCFLASFHIGVMKMPNNFNLWFYAPVQFYYPYITKFGKERTWILYYYIMQSIRWSLKLFYLYINMS